MQQYRKNLGKVSLTAEGVWNNSKQYEILSIVYDEHTQHAFISKKEVPSGVDLYNSEYWMPLNVSGFADNNMIILSKKISDTSIQSYTLEEAIKSIPSVGRKPGIILGFYNFNNDRLDIGGRWELWQFNSTTISEWENVESWQNIYYNYNKFVGWYNNDDSLKQYNPFPEIGCYAFVGTKLNEATVYRCENKYVWTNTTQHSWDYIKVIIDGNVTIGKNGNWFNNGVDTNIPASVKGENGKTPIFRNNNNIIEVSYDNVEWNPISDEIAAWFRWQSEAGQQANSIGKIQITRNGLTWTDLSGEFINNLRISRYIGADESLPISDIAEGTIYAKGPTYADGDTNHSNPIYRLWVYAWKGNTLAWQDNGEFTSITAGIVQETGDNENVVMSQKAVTDKFSELGSKVFKANRNFIDSSNKCSNVIEYEGQYITSLGELEDSESYNTSEIFPIKPNTTYVMKNIPYLSLYNDKDVFLNRINVSAGVEFTTPNNTIKARVSSNVSASAWQLNEGSTLLDYEEPYIQLSGKVMVPTDNTFEKDMPANALATKLKIEKSTVKLKFPFSVSSGSLNNKGGVTDSSTRLVTDYIEGNGILTTQEGYKFVAVCYYNKENLSFDSYESASGKTSITIGKDGCVARVSIGKTDDSNISVNDVLYDNINNTYYNYRFQVLEQSKIDREQLIEYVNKDTYRLFSVNSRYLNTNGRDLASSAGTSCITPYLAYNGGDIVIRGNSGSTTALIHYYDANKAYLGYISGTDNKGKLITIAETDIPQGTAYIRATGLAENGISVKDNILSLRTNQEQINNSIELNADLEWGVLSDGVNVMAASDDEFFDNVRTRNYILIGSNVSFDIDLSIYSPTYWWYDNDGKYLTSSDNVGTKPMGAEMIKITLARVDGTRIDVLPIIKVIGAVGIRKNKHTPLSWKKFSYAVNKVMLGASNEPYDILKDTTEIVYDKGVLMLPPNYSVDGAPVRLAIFCHGSGGFKFGSATLNTNYDKFCRYIANEGYAIMVVNGRTNVSYNTYGDDVYDSFGTPQAVACYKSAYQWIKANYNIKEECVVWGKSSGGIMMGNLASNKSGIPILACAGHAPTLDLFTSTLRLRTDIERMAYARDMAMQGDSINFTDESADNYYTKVSIEAWNSYFKANAWRAVGYNPIWNDTIGVEPSELLTLTLAHSSVDTGVEHPEERAAFEKLPKNLAVPLKIWIAVDDGNVDPRFADYMQKMCRLGGSYYELRWLPANTGKHGATDSGKEINGVMQYPISADVKPKYSDEVLSMPVAYIELVAWWRRFE